MEKVVKFLNLYLIEFEKKFNQTLEGRNKLLKHVLKYVIRSKGKKMRPMFVFLSAKIAGDINESTYRAAAMIELLHTATLVHDDVVDDAMQRRGFFSINAIWKNKIAVLVGDYLLAKGLLLSLEHDEFQLLKITSSAVKEMSEGELLQIEKARRLDITEEIYFEIIRAKTASLLSSACAAGAYSAHQDASIANVFKEFGALIGIAFQIKDDLLDYGQTDTGKRSGADIKEKKMTLPIIHALQVAPSRIKKEIIYIVKNKNTDSDQVKKVLQWVKDYGGFEYAQKKMEEYKNKALEMLQNLPQGEANEAMKELVNFTINRTK